MWPVEGIGKVNITHVDTQGHTCLTMGVPTTASAASVWMCTARTGQGFSASHDFDSHNAQLHTCICVAIYETQSLFRSDQMLDEMSAKEVNLEQCLKIKFVL